MISFDKFIDPLVTKFCDLLTNFELTPAIIGGTVRDYYLGLPNKHDYDIEIRPREELDHNQLVKILSLLKREISKHYVVEELSYHILRIKVDKFTIELSFPREEFFNEDFSHSNFDARLISDLSFEIGMYRRDFTINTMAFVYEESEWQFIDPLNGMKDIDQKILRPCSEDFYKDPVRFLRALRFKHLLQFELLESTIEQFLHKSIDDFSAHYLRLEALKSKTPIIYMLDLYEYLGVGEFESEKKELSQIDHSVSDLRLHLDSLIQLNIELRKSLCDALDYSVRMQDFQLPIKLKEFQFSDFEHFISISDQLNLINLFKKLFELSDTYIQFLYTNNYIDLCYDDLKQMQEFFVDLAGIKPEHRRYFQIYMRLIFIREQYVS